MSDNEFKIILSGGSGDARLQVEYRFADKPGGKELEQQFTVDSFDLRMINVLIGMVKENRMRYEKEFKVLGEILFSLLFLGRDRRDYNAFGSRLKDAIVNSEGLLRIVLEFNEPEPHYAAWPWEYLYWPERPAEQVSNFFLAQRTELLLSRYVMLVDAKGRSPAEPPLRMLFVAPSPANDSNLGDVEAESVRESLEELREHYKNQGQKRLTLNALPPADVSEERRGIVTYPDFVSRLRSADPYVIHFIGHGRYVVGEDGLARGQLAFTYDDGSVHWINDQRFAEEIEKSAPRIRLVVLQACESADTGRSQSYQVVSGVAQWLSQKNIPAVVAMHYSLLGKVGNLFSRTFYEALVERQTVGEAMNRARRALYENEEDNVPLWSSFGLPVLYLRDHAEVLPPFEGPQQPATSSKINQPGGPAYRCPYDGTEFDPAQEEYFCSSCQRSMYHLAPHPQHPNQLCGGIRRHQIDFCQKCGQPWPERVATPDGVIDHAA